jgi:molecular chaperone HtpG
LFVPAKREKSVLAKRKEPGLMLYSHNVMIQEYSTDLLPAWLSFVDGVVDSEDITLNVSRETVQSNRLVRQLAKTIRGRVLRELTKLGEKEPEKYAGFWEQFGRIFKEGLATDFEARDDIMPFLRYHSSQADGELTSLDAYLERMPESQSEIYYVLGDDATSVANSPHLDPFKARQLEVLYWVDPMDALLAPAMPEYQEKKFRNIDDAGLELPKLEEEEAEEPAEPILADADFNRFVGRCVTTLGERIIEVRESKVLKNSPVRLVSPEDAPDRDVQRLHRFLDQEYEVPKKILEVNRNHPLVVNLARLVTDEPDNRLIPVSIEQLYDSALVQEGLHPNPVAMLPRIQELMMLAAEAKSNG